MSEEWGEIDFKVNWGEIVFKKPTESRLRSRLRPKREHDSEIALQLRGLVTTLVGPEVETLQAPSLYKTQQGAHSPQMHD